MADGPTEAFHRLAAEVTGELLSWEPIAATWLGDHRFDERLPDFTSSTLDACRHRIQDWLTELDAIDDVELGTEDNVDLEILRSSLGRVHFEITELKATTWNPMLWNPGTGLHLLNSRDFAPVKDRIASMKGRLRDIPRFLGDAMRELHDMPRVHVETAIAQLQGTSELIRGQIGPLVADTKATDKALIAVADFIEWLTDRLPDSQRSPRLGERLYAATLWHGLDDGTTADELLQQAESYLDGLGERMQDLAAKYLGEDPDTSADAADQVRRALGEIASEAVVTNETVLALVEQVTASTREFVRSHDLVSIPEIDVRIIEMPEIHRGVAVAYCDAPGPLELADVPTFVAVSPTPTDWPQERIASFYREYNAVQLHDLTIHEAFPGHVLQLAHARQLTTATPVRNFGMSGVFVEGWAVYAEQLMIDRGYAPSDDPRSAIALALQQLKMQARMTINAILDVRVHTDTIDEDQALELMRSRGFQEEGEAVGKWRRALLTAGQLPTYFVGFLAVSSIASDLRVLHPTWSDRELHDLMLSHGSPAPRHLRTLLGI
jgi:uncharacterized protein (DUF885 family)